MKALVTGASGFLGSALCSALKARGNEVIETHSKNCDLTQATSLCQFDSIQVDRIFHLASWTQAGDFCLKHPGEQWIINQQINTHILSWWKKSQPQAKLITIGTSCAYDPRLPLHEENYLKGEPIEDLYVYALTKRMLFTGQRALAQQFGLKYLCLVPSTFYGPHYHTDGRQAHFIFDLIRKIIQSKKTSKPAVLWGDGHQRREIIHVKDFVRIALQIDEIAENTLINIGCGKEFTIREYAKKICEIIDSDFKKIEFDTSKYTGARSKCLVNQKLKSLVKDVEFTSIQEGLLETIQWMEKALF